MISARGSPGTKREIGFARTMLLRIMSRHTCKTKVGSASLPKRQQMTCNAKRFVRWSVMLATSLESRESRSRECRLLQPYHAVSIEPVSANRLLKNGNFCGVGWRLSADSRPSCRFLNSWRPLRYAKIPANCWYFAQKWTTNLGRVSAWLPWEGSNHDIPKRISAFEISREFRLKGPVLLSGDFSAGEPPIGRPGDFGTAELRRRHQAARKEAFPIVISGARYGPVGLPTAVTPSCCFSRLVADHPGPRARKTLGAAFRFRYQPRRLFAGTTAAARSMRGLVFGKRLWRVAAALIGGERLAPVGRHAQKIRRGEDCSRRRCLALRASQRQVAFRHRPHVGERAAIGAEIIIDGHLRFLAQSRLPAADAGRQAGRPASRRAGLLVLGERHLDVALDKLGRPGG
jgi:hypothetical protein